MRDFLWGSTLGKRKIHWVRWQDVCKPVLRGLGLRSLQITNSDAQQMVVEIWSGGECCLEEACGSQIWG